MEVFSWLWNAGLIAFGIVWLALAILCIAALVFDCWMEPETTLTTAIPMSDQEPSENAGSFGAMNPLAGEIS